MNKKSFSASIGALILGIQMGLPVVADVVPDEELLENLVLLDCRLLANDEAGMLELLQENGELLRLIRGTIPECLPWQLGDQRLRLQDFKDCIANACGPAENESERSAFAVPSSGPGEDLGFGGGQAQGGGASEGDHQY